MKRLRTGLAVVLLASIGYLIAPITAQAIEPPQELKYLINQVEAGKQDYPDRAKHIRWMQEEIANGNFNSAKM